MEEKVGRIGVGGLEGCCEMMSSGHDMAFVIIYDITAHVNQIPESIG